MIRHFGLRLASVLMLISVLLIAACTAQPAAPTTAQTAAQTVEGAEETDAAETQETESEEPATGAGCNDVEQVTVEEAEDYHAEGEYTADDYQTDPPTGGMHSLDMLSGGEYYQEPDFGAAVHSLDHGQVIIWINDRYEEVGQAVNEIWEGPYESAVILAEYADMEPPLAVTSWDRILTCDGVDEEAIAAVNQFVEDYHAMSPEAEAVCLSASLVGGETLPNCE